MKAVSPLTQKNGSFRSHQVYNMADRSKSCSCASILVIFGFHDASLERWLTQPRRKDYSYQCISEKKRKNSDISVSIVPTCYRHITDCRLSVGRLVVCVCGKTCQPTVGHLLANSQPTDGRQSGIRRPTVDWQSANRFFGELFFTITHKLVLLCYLNNIISSWF